MKFVSADSSITRCNVKGCVDFPIAKVTEISEDFPSIGLCSNHYMETMEKKILQYQLEFDVKEKKKPTRKIGQKWYVDEKGKRRRIDSWGRIKNPAVRQWARNKEQDILAGVEKNKGKEGHVYVFSLGYDDLYKIGKTKNVQKRLIALQAGNPGMRLVISAWVKDSFNIESQLHKMHEKRKVEREVYRLNREYLDGIIRFFESVQKDY